MRPHDPCRASLGVQPLEPRDVPAAAFPTLPELPYDDPAVVANCRNTAELGRQLGRRPDAFMKVGDSNSEFDESLFPLGAVEYNGRNAGLTNARQGLIDTLNAYRTPIPGQGANSFSRKSVAAVSGMKVANAIAATPTELAATNAGVALVLIGTNDAIAGSTGEQFRGHLLQLIALLQSNGVVPILSTFPTVTAVGARGVVRSFELNQIIADVADEVNVPLWNLWRMTTKLPGGGVRDGIHLGASPNGGGSLRPDDLTYGHNARNLQAVEVLQRTLERVFVGYGVENGWVPVREGQRVTAYADATTVTLADTGTGEAFTAVRPFGDGYRGGFTLATGDVNGDGVTDVVASGNLGAGPVAVVISGRTGRELSRLENIAPGFQGGFTVAVGDVNGDGLGDVVVGAGTGGGPLVQVYAGGAFNKVGEFFAYDLDDRGGILVDTVDLGPEGQRIVVRPIAGNLPPRRFPLGRPTPD